MLRRCNNYISLMKPGIIFGNGVTATAGFFLGMGGITHLWNWLQMLTGLSAIIGAACVFNNYIDRDLDKKMARTRGRPLVVGSVTRGEALTLGTFLLISGTVLLGTTTNPIALSCALLGFLIYVGVYSFLKPISGAAMWIGTIAGSMPAIVGYSAAKGYCDGAGYLLFAIMMLWQLPHFLAISLYRIGEYSKATIPVLPITHGVFTTKVYMLLSTLLFALASISLAWYGYTGVWYLTVVTILSICWSALAISGFCTKNDGQWAKRMFLFSLMTIMSLSVVLSMDTR